MGSNQSRCEEGKYKTERGKPKEGNKEIKKYDRHG
jgi:hypothetical protein